jgi:hypothetical protein
MDSSRLIDHRRERWGDDRFNEPDAKNSYGTSGTFELVEHGVASGHELISQQSTCLVGAYCSHATLTLETGIYRCPFGTCFKRREASE